MERRPAPVWLLSVVLLLSGFLLTIIHGAEIRTEPAACNGSIAECQAAEEFLLDSETHRRFLQQGQHISDSTLDKDRPACDPGKGNSYANCLPPVSGNPPNRDCKPYDHCRV